MTPLRVGVVGVGHLGRHHARLYAADPQVTLVGVVDQDEKRAGEIAAASHCPAYTDAAVLLDQVDAISVAVPTIAHTQVALPFLAKGIACLVEKPLAATVAEARQLVDAAAASGALLMTGHTERFSPAMQAARPHVHRPGFIEAQRMGSFTDRSTDVDVVLDLMIHDIDAVLDLVGEKPVAVDAVGVSALTDKVDLANARLRFPSGCAANLTASRMSLGKVRKLRLFQADAYITIDTGSGEALRYSLLRREGARPEIRGEALPVAEGEPLAAELEEFVAAVNEKRPPLCTGEDGLAALEIAIAIRETMSSVEALPSDGA
jgi:predicted dehydrogenase